MSSDVPQDPCRQWLGIDAVDLGDHRRVLGVAPEERDPLAVLRAAEARLVRLRGVSAGSMEFVRAGFVKRVEAARESVLAEIAASGSRDPQAGHAAFRRPPAPSTLAAARPPVPVPPPPVPPPAVVKAGEEGGVPPISIRTTVYRKQTPVAGIVLSMLGLACVAGGLGYVMVLKQARRGDGSVAVPEKTEAVETMEDAVAVRAVDGTGRPSPATATEDADRPAPRARKRRPRTSETTTPDAAPVPAAAPVVERASSKPRPAEDAAAKPRPPAAAPEEETRAESRLLDASLAEVLDGLRSASDDGVDLLLKTAVARARTQAGRRRIAGWQQLVANYRTFLASREAALDAVKPGASYQVGGQKVVIERLDDQTCVFRASGAPKTVPRRGIPDGITLAVVAAWDGDGPDGDLAIAAYQMLRAEPNLRHARELLDKAGEAGGDISLLLPLVDDPLIAAAERE